MVASAEGRTDPRGNRVIQAIVAGLSTKEIVQQLFISENMVETHRQNISEKLGSHGVAEMIIKAIAASYINLITPIPPIAPITSHPSHPSYPPPPRGRDGERPERPWRDHTKKPPEIALGGLPQ